MIIHRLLKYSFVFALIIFSNACSNTNEVEPAVGNGPSQLREDLAINIEALEDSLIHSSESEKAKAFSIELLRMSTQFVNEFPKDPRCAEYAFMGARAASGLGSYEKSLSIMENIKKVYADYPGLAEVYFLYAFTLDEELGRKDDARQAYIDLINKFPDSPLSEQSVLLLEQLYLSDEELIEKWRLQEQNK
jgi:tetratricopeptide (TPR) repeat protein